ncbi:hypothetical protein BGZ46_010179 [Entomortierella lignicola]|nr:hypothetical protein BGZ46_010179 [Entomortierella lignicola]
MERFNNPITCLQIENRSLERAWRGLARSIVDHVMSVIHVQRDLRSFYSSTIFKIKTRRLEQIKNAILNSKVINITGCNEKWQGQGSNLLFMISDGNFGPSRGPVVHQKFISLLKQKT